ncbi:hypothetical protein GN330_22840 [Nitratireductor sp. CAU 1489]|uniref:Uncharacterized protein n=1 Tax=Nitratireductor arenosus TaxID=2682096 RepID=A0A844QJL8_9HYPH|nr:hypothetical protein [Nitratireductor arenosus]MVB00087.1 hypothetical protein [Nitratireductor arenosus]
MGTRAIIHVKNGDKDSDTLVTVYRQFDGYPTGLGDDIKSILGGKAIVNGYNDPSNVVNGMKCAAAMLIAGLKDGCGNVYIYPAGTSDVWEEYTYTIYALGDRLHLVCDATYGDGSEVYSGWLDDFDGAAVEQSEAA